MAEEHWQLQLIHKSLKKKEKLRLLKKYLCVEPSSLILDLGCAQGILSFFLRQKGGKWISTDQDFINLKSSQELLERNLLQIGEGPLPFKNESLDMVVSLDYLEHLDDDQFCLQEISRILKQDGQLLLAIPRTGKIFMLHKLRPILGMKLDFYGHKREGYALKHLKSKLEKENFHIIKRRSFSGFLTELTELILNWVYIKFYSSPDDAGLRDGHIRPATAEEYANRKKTIKVYGFFYPPVWLITRLDRLFFFQRGYGLMLWARKRDRPGG